MNPYQSSVSIVLASTSPRRQHLLALSNIEFSTLGVDIDESIEVSEQPTDYILRMVSDKAMAACNALTSKFDTSVPLQDATRIKDETKNKASLFKLIVTADTIGVLPDGKSVLVKPQDKADALTMWSKMSGTTHQVWTAVQLTLIDNKGMIVDTDVVLEKTEITFIELTKSIMNDYWQTGEPQDKAGGYAIQGGAAGWVERINGSYTNVVGLPLSQTIAAINKITDVNMP